jgi:hypothetical protein
VKLTKRFATISTAATAAVLLSAGGAQAQGDGGLLSLLDDSPLLQVCYPMGQVGQGNSFTGTQNINCSQNAEVTAPTNGNGGGVTGAEVAIGETRVAPGTSGTAIATCPEGKVATGGGFGWVGGPPVRYTSSFPLVEDFDTPPTQWAVNADNENPPGSEVSRYWAYAVCVDAAE